MAISQPPAGASSVSSSRSAEEVPSVDAASAVERLRVAFRSGRTKPLAWRQRQLAGLRAMLVEQNDALCMALRADLGRAARNRRFWSCRCSSARSTIWRRPGRTQPGNRKKWWSRHILWAVMGQRLDRPRTSQPVANTVAHAMARDNPPLQAGPVCSRVCRAMGHRGCAGWADPGSRGVRPAPPGHGDRFGQVGLA